MREHSKIANRLMGYFQPFKKPGSNELIVFHQTFLDKFCKELPELFRTCQKMDVSIVREHQITSRKLNTRNLLLATQLAKVMGVHIYCRRVMMDDIVDPFEQITIIGPGDRVMFVKFFLKYTHALEESIHRNKADWLDLDEKARAIRAKHQREFYYPLCDELESMLGYEHYYTPQNTLMYKDGVLLDYILKNFIFDNYNIHKDKPIKRIKEITWSGPTKFKNRWLIA